MTVLLPSGSSLDKLWWRRGDRLVCCPQSDPSECNQSVGGYWLVLSGPDLACSPASLPARRDSVWHHIRPTTLQPPSPSSPVCSLINASSDFDMIRTVSGSFLSSLSSPGHRTMIHAALWLVRRPGPGPSPRPGARLARAERGTDWLGPRCRSLSDLYPVCKHKTNRVFVAQKLICYHHTDPD